MEENDHLGKLEQELYARDPDNVPKRTFGILRPVRQNVTSTWGETTVPKEQNIHKSAVGGYRRFFIFSFLFFLLALGGAAFSIYRGSLTLSSKNVDVSILGNSFVAAGDNLPLQVEIANSNSAALLNATIALDYPKGATDPDGNSTVHVQQTIGTINAGQTKSQSFSAVLYGEQGTSQTITATLTYSLQSSSAVFQKQATFSVIISSSPLALTVDGPSSIAAGQPFQLTIHNTFSGTTPLSDVVTRVDYPNGFTFTSATPAPTGNNNIWSLGDLENGTDRAITIQGTLTGQENEQQSFRIYSGTPVSATDSTIATVYNSTLETITLAQPFINAQLNINGQTSDIAAVPTGTPISGIVSWTNNSAQTITSPTFTVTLAGTSINANTISAKNGYYNAADNTITWTGDSDPDIATIAPGQSGTLNFSFSPTAGDTSDANVKLSVEGTFPANNYAQQTITDIDAKTIRYSAHLQFASQAFYSVGPLKNTGPFPPKSNQTTTYTVTWTAQPSENALTNIVATAVLPLGVDWVGALSPSSAAVTYNSDTRVITWNVGVLPQASSTAQSPTVSFQISARPTASQVGAALPLLGVTTVTGTDSVVNVPLTTTRPALTTALDSDPAYSVGDERVLP